MVPSLVVMQCPEMTREKHRRRLKTKMNPRNLPTTEDPLARDATIVVKSGILPEIVLTAVGMMIMMGMVEDGEVIVVGDVGGALRCPIWTNYVT